MLVRIADRIVNFVVLIFTMLLILYGVYAFWDTRQVYDAASAQKYKTYKPEKDDSVSFEQLQAQNPEVIGWLHVYGTKIDYPFTQAEDNSKYVNTDVMGEYALSGSLFLDCMNAPDFSNFNNIIYGHHMRNGTMFADLVKLRDQRFVKKHDLIRLYLPEKTIDLTIVSAYAGKVQRIPIAFKSKEAKEEWEDEIKNRSEIISRKKLEVRIYTFVTCSYERENNRTYVYAIERKNTK